jgi:HlyD family secretion protein
MNLNKNFSSEQSANDVPHMNIEDKAKDSLLINLQQDTKKKKRNKKNKKKLVLIVIAVVAVFAIIFPKNFLPNPKNSANLKYSTAVVERHSITETLKGSGSLQPADSYTVTSLIQGKILSANFKEGDIVDKDKVLYTIDSSDVTNNIKQAELNLSQSQRAYQSKIANRDDLTIKSKEAGKVTELTVSNGDNVTIGQKIATVIDSTAMKLTLPFPSYAVASFHVGQSAKVTIDGSSEIHTGTISKIAGNNEVLEGNISVRQVTIDVTNPGAIYDKQPASAKVEDISCYKSGTLTYKNQTTITSSSSGKVAQIYAPEGTAVSKNQAILLLSSKNLDDEIANAESSLQGSKLSLANQNDKLDSYTISSPIKGTIVEKDYKEGDTLETMKPLCIIYDLSYLTITMSVDELDIEKVKVGQEVKILADAVKNKTFNGKVTKININGTTTGGVTSYPVTIRIDKTDGLLPGMNVDAMITVQKSENVLAIPADAVAYANRTLVKTDTSNKTANDKKNSDIPEGFSYVNVITGASDEDYVEIKEGLKEGDTIAYIKKTAKGSSISSVMGPNGGRGPNNGNLGDGPNDGMAGGGNTGSGTSEAGGSK